MGKYKDDMEFLRRVVPKKDAMVLLAEECGELAQAAIKYYRMDSESIPTPLSEDEIHDMLKEELTDILVTAAVAGVKQDGNLYDEKVSRWVRRINEEMREMGQRMHSVFVSVPMNGRKNEDIFDDISQRVLEYSDEKNLKESGETYSYLDNLYVPEEVLKEANNAKKPALVYLAWALRQMSDCEDVIFAGNWQDARGCQVEKLVYDLYFKEG